MTKIKKNATSIKIYTEAGFKPIQKMRLSNREYAKALQALVIACVDIVVINRKHKFFYLAFRRAKPVRGVWWLGGRVFPGETDKVAALRCLKRETGLKVESDRLKLVASVDYMFKDREQKPQNIGCHTRSHVFAAELNPEEISFASRHLDEDEYDRNFGLKPFTYKALIKAKARPIIIDLYKDIFKDKST